MLNHDFLKSEYLKRRKKNSRYSIRSFARDLGVSHTLISKIFSGDRKLSSRQAIRISILLGWSDRKTKALLESFVGMKERGSVNFENKKPYYDLQLNYELIMSSWYHSALLEMTFLKHFRNDPIWIARQLGITVIEVKESIDRLKKVEILEDSEGRLRKTNDMLKFCTSRSQSSVRSYYSAVLGKAIDELKRTSDAAFHARRISGGTMAIRKEKIPLAIKRLSDFQDEFMSEFSDKDADDVYQLGMLFFSNLQKGESK